MLYCTGKYLDNLPPEKPFVPVHRDFASTEHQRGPIVEWNNYLFLRSTIMPALVISVLKQKKARATCHLEIRIVIHRQ
ncbi:MAG: hypothetical protein AAFN78_10525 [Pseudomonadota bacterium]